MLAACFGSDVAEIRIFSRDEKKQHDMRLEYHEPRLKFYIGDVRDPDSLRDALEGVDYVFHAAALKQVPSCEFYPMEALMTNCLGAENVMNAALSAGVQAHGRALHRQGRLSDQRDGHLQGDDGKLAGAKSRVAASQGLTICVTRYGNVMGSRGSVIPLFVEQIRAGEPLTVTDPQHDPLHDDGRGRRGPGAVRVRERRARRPLRAEGAGVHHRERWSPP